MGYVIRDSESGMLEGESHHNSGCLWELGGCFPVSLCLLGHLQSIVASGSILVIELLLCLLNCFVEILNGFLVVVQPAVGDPSIIEIVRNPSQLNGLVEVCQSLLRFPIIIQSTPSLAPILWVLIIDQQADSEVADSLLVHLRDVVDEGSVLISIGVIILQRDSCAEVFDCILEIPQHLVADPSVVVVPGILPVAFDCFTVRSQ